MKEHIIEVNTDLCIGCCLCKKDCSARNISIKEGKATIKGLECIKCGHCVAICPKAAVTMTGFEEAPLEYTKQPTLDSKELLMALKARKYIRNFKNKEVIQQIIEAGRVTTSAKNAQDVSYIVLGKNKGRYERVAVEFLKKIKPLVSLVMKSAKEVTIDDNFFFKRAPVAILVVTKDKISGSLAAANMALLAEANGVFLC